MPDAYSYARFSSKKQKDGSSLSRQNQGVADWLKRHPQFVYRRNFQDLGRSAYKGKHLEHDLGELLTAIKSKEIKKGDVILVEAIDRLGRLPELRMFSLINQIIEAGVTIVTLIDQTEYGPEIKPEQIWSLTGKIQQAHTYSKNLGSRISDSYKNRKQLAANGIIPKRRTPIWLNSDGTLKPSISTAMKIAFEDALTGMGERRILRRLTETDPIFKTKNPTTVRKWLTNKAAIGYWHEHRIYPPIVSDDLFYQVQKRFEDSYKPATAPTKHFLSGLVKCGHCGSNMQVKANKHSPYTMTCVTRSKFGVSRCENGRTFPVPVLQYICNDTATSALQQALTKIELSDSQKELIVIDGKINETSTKIQNLGKAIQICGLTPELQAQLTEQINERAKLENHKHLITVTEPEPEIGLYEKAWDEQYKLIENDPMRLNCLLQSARYALTCYVNGEIRTSTTGNTFSACQYNGYDRKLQTYLIKVEGEIHRLENSEGSVAKERSDKLKSILHAQRQATDYLAEPTNNEDVFVLLERAPSNGYLLTATWD